MGKIKILVVEDNPADVELLRWALQDAELDCELIVLDDGGEGLAFAQQRGKYAGSTPPDLAILDLNLPKNDGIEILEALRANPMFADTPVAILSSSSSPRERARMEVFRIGRYITKPADLDEYLKVGGILRELLLQTRPS
jgi:chemotaxis family two-component system response regulator Rcp1